MGRFPTTVGPGDRSAAPGDSPKPGGATPPTLAGVHPLGAAVAALVAGRTKPGPAGAKAPPVAEAELAQATATFAREADRLAREGARLIRKGRPAQAIAPLSRAVALDPRSASAQHDLGMALKNTGRLEEAVAPFTAAIELDPGVASAHFGLGYIFDCLGRDGRAMTSYEAAVRLDPGIVAAQLRLGDMYMARRCLPEAEAAFRAVAHAAAGSVTGRTAEARALEAAQAFDEALEAITAVLEIWPNDPTALGVRGRYLGERGQFAEAAAHFERATRHAPDLGVLWAGVATHHRFTADDGHLIARMNACLARPAMAPFHRQQVHFALGKAHNDMGAYELAITHFEAGNRLRAQNVLFNKEGLVRRVDELIEATPSGYRDRQPDPGVDDATPILIVGLPRSGSTLVEQILSSHPDVAAGGELEFWGRRDVPRTDTWSITPNAEATRRLADDYLAVLRAIGPDARRVTDKALNNFMLLGVIHRVFPNATLIHCRRHPIDNCLSIFMTGFESNIDYASDRGRLVFFYRQYEKLMVHWRKVLPADRFIEVNYEDLVADPEPHTRRLVAACGLGWSDACLSPQDNPRLISTASAWQARQPIYRSSVERWRRYEPWLGELRELAPTV
jgi:tetratricopeptide (TPR) repeat protein